MIAPSADRPAGSETAFVTLITNDHFVPGARALVHSLAHTGTDADIVVMHTGGISDAALADLPDRARLVHVEKPITSDAFQARHERAALHGAAPFLKGRKPSFHSPLDNFAKLRLWQLEEYRRVAFIDADAIALRNIDRLFHYPQFSAAPNVYDTLADFRRMNSGVFVAEPSEATYQDMIERLDTPEVFWRRTDQTFLQSYFPAWHGLPVYYNMLQYVWLRMPDLWDWQSIHVLHYQYEKPWEEDHPLREELRPLIDLWQAYHDGCAPDLSRLSNPAA